MTEDTNEETHVSPTNTETSVSPRVWPAIVIVALQFLVSILAAQIGTLTIHGAIAYYIAPLAGAILLSLWWLFASRVPWRDRILGVIIFAALTAATMYVRVPSDFRILMVALPALNAVTVAAITITASMAWPKRRLVTLAAMVGCAVLVSLLRVDGVSGALQPQISWRFTPTAEDTLAATADAEPTHTGGTADLPPALSDSDWPGFRGPNRDGIVRGVTFDTDWASNPPKELWRIPIGLGWSSFTVIGDYIFTQEQRGDAEVVVCYSAGTGDEVWRNQVAARFNDPMGSGPRGTPEYHEGNLYTQGATGIVMCLDAATGETKWSSNVMEDTGAKLPTWGFSSSPLVADGKVIVYTGAPDDKAVVAYDASTGDVAWVSGGGSHGYSSGQLTEIDGVAQVLMSSNYGVQSLALTDGELLWENVWNIESRPRVVQPTVLGEGKIIGGTGLGIGARLLQVTHGEGGWSVDEQWTSRRFRPYFNDIVLYDGFLYGYDGNRIACINAETGEEAWRGPNTGGQVLLVEDMGVLVVLTEDGDLALVKADPAAHTEIARVSALDSKTWNHPVIAYGKLFVRNDQEAICFELPAAE